VNVKMDPFTVEAASQPSSFEMIEAAIMGLVEQRSPAERALHDRLEQLSAEQALALLNAGTSDCASTAPEKNKQTA
jgi:hypothetical protein